MTILAHPTRSRRYSEPLIKARNDAFAAGQFEWVGQGSKLRCATCTEQSPSAYGYPGGSWMDKHCGPHVGCLACQKVVPLATFAMHRHCRWNQATHPEEN